MKASLTQFVYGDKKAKSEHLGEAMDEMKKLSDFDIKNKDKEEVALVTNEIIDLAMFINRNL